MNIKTWFIFLMISIVGVLLALANTTKIFEYYLLENQQSEINKSDEAFNWMMDVLTHQRCVNCHPNDNIPKQGNDRHPHYFGMARGEDDKGFQATNCNTCHNSENNTYSGVPGAPHWSLAPARMGWEGLTRSQIA
jgi:cytochrome c553